MERLPLELSVIDLDAVTTVRPHAAVVEAMCESLRSGSGHPDAAHRPGARARWDVERVRGEVAALLGVDADAVTFTSGAAEADNLAVKGVAARLAREGRASAAVAAHERPSLLHPARTAFGRGLEVVPVAREGRVDPARLLAGSPDFVAVGHAHAELGALQPVAEICAAARSVGTIVLVDAALTCGRIPIPVGTLGRPDLVTISFHHFGGPMGVGALIRPTALEIPPLIEGGPAELGRRAGTPNLPGIVGAGVAARLARRDLEVRERALRAAAAALARDLLAVPGVRLAGPPPSERLPGHLSVVVDGVDGEALVVECGERGVLASTGSPCGVDAGFRSSALRAAGHDDRDARSLVVFCVPPTDIPDPAAIQMAAARFGESVRTLRRIWAALPRNEA